MKTEGATLIGGKKAYFSLVGGTITCALAAYISSYLSVPYSLEMKFSVGTLLFIILWSCCTTNFVSYNVYIDKKFKRIERVNESLFKFRIELKQYNNLERVTLYKLILGNAGYKYSTYHLDLSFKDKCGKRDFIKLCDTRALDEVAAMEQAGKKLAQTLNIDFEKNHFPPDPD